MDITDTAEETTMGSGSDSGPAITPLRPEPDVEPEGSQVHDGPEEENGGGSPEQEEEEEPASTEPAPPEPADYELSGMFDGDMRFLSCTRCGALVAADKDNITRHDEMHVQHAETGSPKLAPMIQPGLERVHEGDDIAQLLRDVVLEEIHLRGIKQMELAKMVNVSQKHLSQMFTGAAVGSLELWSKIAKSLDRKWSVTLTEH